VRADDPLHNTASDALAEYQRGPRRSLRSMVGEIGLWTWAADLSDFDELRRDVARGARLGSEERLIVDPLLTLVDHQIQHRDREAAKLRRELDRDGEGDAQ